MATTGAREAKPSWFSRTVSRAMSRDLRAFVVPGEDVARAYGLDLGAAGLRVADTPRHASLLVLVGELPRGLKRSAAVAYAQMPRPRVILAVGADDVRPLPGPDVFVAPDQERLMAGVEELRSLFVRSAFRDEVSDFDVDDVRTQTEYTCTMHPEVVREEPGSCPICGMDLVQRKSVDGKDHEHEDHGSMDHERHDEDDGSAAHEEVGELAHEGHGGMDHGQMDHGQMDHGHMDHGHMDHGHMDHGDMDFMSMIEMTKDLPRSRDGLPMEWVTAPFGPLFPGLPGGLSLSLTLDGDAAAEARATSAVGGSFEELSGPVENFEDRMRRLDPLSPDAYRLLAMRALEDATGRVPEEKAALARVGALERERAASHLGWLSSLGRLLGHERLRRRAAGLQLALLGPVLASEVPGLRVETRRLILETNLTPLLKRRLRGVGGLPTGHRTHGPVARANGERADARLEEEAYRGLGFEPVVLGGGDALARLRVRLAELEWSVGALTSTPLAADTGLCIEQARSGEGSAAVETPRGLARLRLRLEDGVVSVLELSTPSTAHLALIGELAEDLELSEFLVGVSSLDISPWEVIL